jgi:hypothetical protein
MKGQRIWVGTKMLVSSANKIGTDLSFINLGKSFINKRKCRGPKTELCGTPCSTLDKGDVVLWPFSGDYQLFQKIPV